MRFGNAIQFAGVLTRRRFGPQGRFQTLFDKTLAHAGHRGRLHFQRLANRFVTPGRSLRTTIGLQQNTGMQQDASSGLAAANQLEKLGLFFRG